MALLLPDRITNSRVVKISESFRIISGQHLGNPGAVVGHRKAEGLWGRFATRCRHLQLCKVDVKQISPLII